MHENFSTIIRRTDSGRKLLSVATLAAGGAIIAVSAVGVVGSLVGKPPSTLVDSIVAAVGAAVSFAFLFRTFNIFDK